MVDYRGGPFERGEHGLKPLGADAMRDLLDRSKVLVGERDGQVEVAASEAGVTLDTTTGVPTLYAADNGRKQLIYFFRGYVFHPGARPKSQLKTRMKELPGTRTDRRVLIVDTGWDDAVFLPLQKQVPLDPVDDDWFVSNGKSPSPDVDVVRGHGPAIYDLIHQLTGTEDRLELHRVRYEDGCLKGPLMWPTGNANNPGEFVRGFDAKALLSTLENLVLQCGDIVVLSLGTVTGNPEDLYCQDPVWEWMSGWSEELRESVDLVVAAGNHGDEQPSYPAGYQFGRDRCAWITAVGSSSNNVDRQKNPDSSEIHSFSARGDWVQCWRNGADVPVRREPNPGHFAFQTRSTTWTGTSFAAPIKAAELAMGHHTAPVGKESEPGAVMKEPKQPNLPAPDSSQAGAIRAKLAEHEAYPDVPTLNPAGRTPRLSAKLVESGKNLLGRFGKKG